VSLVAAPDVPGDELRFVLLPHGVIVAEIGSGAEGVAAAIALAPPCRVEAHRRTPETWAVGATTIEVVELPAVAIGDEIEIVRDGAEQSVRVDGEPTLLAVPELEQLGAGRFPTWVVRASRLLGTCWEVEIEPL
jgi:hypothetical protein